MFKELINWYLSALDQGGYGLVALLMAIESSIVPLPSELVIPPAAHLAVTQGKFNIPGLIVAGAVGSWFGATVMYWVSRLAGRPLILRFGRYFLITPEKVRGAEQWADHYGSMGIFMARLLPVVRHLIGIPAGIVRMNYWKYSLYTLVGSAIWSAVLCWVGIKAGQDQKLLAGDMHQITLWLVGAMLALGGLYYLLVHRHMHGTRNMNVQRSTLNVQRSTLNTQQGEEEDGRTEV
jgi:membrane protein DedA with SNARE-associated domain